MKNDQRVMYYVRGTSALALNLPSTLALEVAQRSYWYGYFHARWFSACTHKNQLQPRLLLDNGLLAYIATNAPPIAPILHTIVSGIILWTYTNFVFSERRR